MKIIIVNIVSFFNNFFAENVPYKIRQNILGNILGYFLHETSGHPDYIIVFGKKWKHGDN
jgi:hypothetical protein